MSTPLLFELNLIGISSIGVFNLRSVATYRPVEIPQYDVTMGPTTDTSAAILLTIGRYEEQYSCLMLSYNPLSTAIIYPVVDGDCLSAHPNVNLQENIKGNNTFINIISAKEAYFNASIVHLGW